MSEQAAVSLDELQAWVGREHAFAGVDAVTRNDIRRKLEVYCFDCPLHYDDAIARAHGYRGVVAPVALTPLWAMPAYWSPGEPVLWQPGLREQAGGIRTDVPVPAANEEDLYHLDEASLARLKAMPGSLGEAIEELKSSELVKVTLGDPLFDRYVQGRVQEWDEYRMYVSQWELERYLPVY